MPREVPTYMLGVSLGTSILSGRMCQWELPQVCLVHYRAQQKNDGAGEPGKNLRREGLYGEPGGGCIC